MCVCVAWSYSHYCVWLKKTPPLYVNVSDSLIRRNFKHYPQCECNHPRITRSDSGNHYNYTLLSFISSTSFPSDALLSVALPLLWNVTFTKRLCVEYRHGRPKADFLSPCSQMHKTQTVGSRPKLCVHWDRNMHIHMKLCVCSTLFYKSQSLQKLDAQDMCCISKIFPRARE